MHIMAHISIRLKYGMTRLVHGTASDSPTQELTRALNAAQACTSCGATARLTCAELGTRPQAAANAIGKQIREKKSHNDASMDTLPRVYQILCTATADS